jgi:hypothetical protein
MLVDAPRQHAAATSLPSGRRRQRQHVRGRFKRARASRDRRLAGTNDNPVLIAVLTAFIGPAQDHRAPHGRRQGRPGVIGATEPVDLVRDDRRHRRPRPPSALARGRSLCRRAARVVEVRRFGGPSDSRPTPRSRHRSDIDLDRQVMAPGATWLDYRLVERERMPLAMSGSDRKCAMPWKHAPSTSRRMYSPVARGRASSRSATSSPRCGGGRGVSGSLLPGIQAWKSCRARVSVRAIVRSRLLKSLT